MVVAEILLAGLLVGLGLWAMRRHATSDELALAEPRLYGGGAPRAPRGRAAAAGVVAVDVPRIEGINRLVSQRLWRLAFGAASEPGTLEPAHLRIRNAIQAALQTDRIDPKYLPRRPTLMPQLLRAMDDPRIASERLSRIVAHDPVLAADVLRLANSSPYRATSAPIENIHRAVVVLGVDALRGLLASAMLQPVFRATRSNFPRFPRMLWERTERAVHAAEGYALRTRPQDRFEAQLAVLLSALGPLAVYGAALDVYAHSPDVAPSAPLLAAMTGALAAPLSLQIAHHWETSTRLILALERSNDEPLAAALSAGELCGTLSLLESQSVITPEEAAAFAADAGLAADDEAGALWHHRPHGALH
jgi:HD-like signal output (HDOD) protein